MQNNIKANKSFGQNFLLDENLTDKIVKSAGNIEEKNILEIGPGPGGLTKSILKQKPKKLICIELDKRFYDMLKETFIDNKNIEIMLGDALNINPYNYFKENFSIIANLPYNVATPLFFKWLEIREYIDNMTLMFQKEVVERIIAKPKTKEYGRISVMAQCFCDVKKQFDISPKAFTPPPKVTSSVVSIIPRKDNKYDIDFNKLSKVCEILFGQRRKTIKNNLGKIAKDVEKFLQKLSLKENLRAEELSIIDFVNITNLL